MFILQITLHIRLIYNQCRSSSFAEDLTLILFHSCGTLKVTPVNINVMLPPLSDAVISADLLGLLALIEYKQLLNSVRCTMEGVFFLLI